MNKEKFTMEKLKNYFNAKENSVEKTTTAEKSQSKNTNNEIKKKAVEETDKVWQYSKFRFTRSDLS